MPLFKPRVGNAVQEANRRRLAELEQRSRATNLLSPEEVSAGLSAGRVLLTTLGGTARPITPKDLAAFRRSIAALSPKIKQGGLTASEALALTLPSRIESARADIHSALLHRIHAGRLDFVTSAGKASRHSRHFVTAVLTQFNAAIARPGTPLASATWLCKEGFCKWSCSCEDWRFRFAFLATSGAWIAQYPQANFPDERNPELQGALCKHGVRVAVELQSSGAIRARVAEAIKAERARLDRPGKAKPIVLRQAEAEALAPKRTRRIPAVVQPEQRTGLPKAASAGDLQKALAHFGKLKDANSAAIARALSAVINHQAAR